MELRGSGKLGLFLFSFAALAALALFPRPVHAATQYVSDTLTITMREGGGNQYRIIRYLKTGTPIEVLREEGEYYHIRTKEGEKGWVRAQYITPDIPKTTVMASLKKKIERLKAETEEAKKARQALREELEAARRSHAGKTGELERLVKEGKEEAARLANELKQATKKHETLLTRSKNVVELLSERNMLYSETERLGDVERRLKKENDRLTRIKMLYWFLAGGGVFFVGWLVGKVSRQKRYY